VLRLTPFLHILALIVPIALAFHAFKSTSATAQAALNTVTCRTGFDRPLLFGINPEPSGRTLVETKEAGSTIASVSIHWDRVQPNGSTSYVTDEYAFPIRKWQETGMVLVANFSGTPRWASANTNLGPEDAQPRKDAATTQAFRNYISKVVGEHKHTIKYWSYWNEPNGCMSSLGSCGYTRDTARDFVHWHNIFYDEVKRIDSGATVIVGNLEMVKDDFGYIDLMNEFGAKYDMLGFECLS
jgi:hypothetical protein